MGKFIEKSRNFRIFKSFPAGFSYSSVSYDSNYSLL